MTASEWFWVILGYGTAYGAIAAYYLTLRWRSARVQRMLEALR